MSTTVEVERAAGRSRAYGALARAFTCPTSEVYDEIITGRLAEALGAPENETLRPDLPFEEFQAEYLRLFEVGPRCPPCPLYEGAWREREFLDRRELMEELVRFYHYFGLTLGERPKELPDHLSVELEFLHYLAFLEAQTLELDRDPASCRRARRDFLERHPLRWLPQLRDKLYRLEALPFFRELACLAVEQAREDQATLTLALKGG
jgi:DMSO reductase family type II enzyme chaperone